jgi:hypothetical protein
VHNAAAGYWSIATRSQEPSTSLCGHDGSFAAGLLEAAVQAASLPTALIAYDYAYPHPLDGVRHVPASFGVALVLTSAPGSGSMAALDVEFVPGESPSEAMPDAELEVLRTGVPAARSLPLLAALARGGEARLALEFGAGAHLTVAISPCA